MGLTSSLPRCRHSARPLPRVAPALLALALWATGLSAAGDLLLAPTPAGALAVWPPQVQTGSDLVAAACGARPLNAGHCDQVSLAAINEARAAEGVAPMSLPPGYERLGTVEQLVVVTNLERSARGLETWDGPAASLDQRASKGVSADVDPGGPAGRTWASNIARGVVTALEADYEWMYNDGPGGSNADCASTAQQGCWEHRTNILRKWPGSIGAAAQAQPGPTLVVAEVMVANT